MPFPIESTGKSALAVFMLLFSVLPSPRAEANSLAAIQMLNHLLLAGGGWSEFSLKSFDECFSDYRYGRSYVNEVFPCLVNQDFEELYELAQGPEQFAMFTLGTTVFSEARMESRVSQLTVAAMILKRAGGDVGCLMHATVNSQFSPWLLARQSISNGRCNDNAVRVQSVLYPNRMIEANPAAEAELDSAFSIAACAINHRTELMGIVRDYHLGTHFMNPTAVTRRNLFNEHRYAQSVGTAYCPGRSGNSSQGLCSRAARWDTRAANRGVSQHYYELEESASPARVRELHQRLERFVEEHCCLSGG